MRVSALIELVGGVLEAVEGESGFLYIGAQRRPVLVVADRGKPSSSKRGRDPGRGGMSF